MNNRRTYVGLALSSALALAAACGGNDENSNMPGGSAGSGGTAGATAGTTSSGTSSAGTTVAGGVSVAGDAAVGGAGMAMQPGCPAEKPEAGAECMRRNGPGGGACTYGEESCLCNANAWACYSQADCPASAPEDAAACDLNGMSCSYDALRCTCSTMNGWSCQEPCPEAQPADDAACRRPAAATCRYQDGMVVGFNGTADATCACSDGKFNCFTQEDCPADAPSTGDACTTTTLACTYTGERCACGVDGSWTCITDCPATLPVDGDACERTQACRYSDGMLLQGMGMGMGAQADATCACNEMKFACLTQADCPTTTPADATACALPGLTCAYDTQSCRCRTSTEMWTCSDLQGAGGAGSGGATGAGGAQ